MNNYQRLIAEGRATGECDHPESSVVALANVSHVIRESWWDNQEVWGKVEVLDTPKGKIIQELMRSGVKIGISSRGVGETTKNSEGVDVVDENFTLLAFDLVSEPSTHEAFLHEGSNKKQVAATSKADRINRTLIDILKK